MCKKILLFVLVLCLGLSTAAGAYQLETQTCLPLKDDDRGILVLQVQNRLKELGFMYSMPDGIYGASTIEAVKWLGSYLQQWGYTQGVSDGTLTSEMYDLLMGDVFPEGGTDFTLGAKSDDIIRMQRRLMQLGYLDVVTGNYAEKSRDAVASFQNWNGLPQTGIADVQTRQLLYSNKAMGARVPIHERIIYLNLELQKMYVYKWNGNEYCQLEETFVCSTGGPGYETEKGIYQESEQLGEWYQQSSLEKSIRWGIRISGTNGTCIMGSVLYNERADGKEDASSVSNLGSKVTNGNIHLSVKNAQWLFNNYEEGLPIIVY